VNAEPGLAGPNGYSGFGALPPAGIVIGRLEEAARPGLRQQRVHRWLLAFVHVRLWLWLLEPGIDRRLLVPRP